MNIEIEKIAFIVCTRKLDGQFNI